MNQDIPDLPLPERGSNQYRRQRAACAGKDKYLKPEYADREVARAVEAGRAMTSFRCRHCGYWHIEETAFTHPLLMEPMTVAPFETDDYSALFGSVLDGKTHEKVMAALIRSFRVPPELLGIRPEPLQNEVNRLRRMRWLGMDQPYPLASPAPPETD